MPDGLSLDHPSAGNGFDGNTDVPRTVDTTLFYLIHRDLAAPWLDPVMVWVSRWWFIAALGLLFFHVPRERHRVLLILGVAVIALGGADLLGAVMKDLVGRERPCVNLDDVRVLVGCGGSGSFPSNHAATATAVVAVLTLTLRSPARMVFPLLAVLVGWSRVYLGVHYPGDVAGGMLLGAGIGVLAARFALPFLEGLYRRHPDRVLLGTGLILLTAFRLVYVARGPLDLSGDEAHYWEWSRRLDWSYYSKGPLVAYAIRLFTSILGTGEVAVRAGAAFFSLLTSVVLYDLARRLYRTERAGLWAATLFQITPAFFVYGVVMTIDPPFFFFWTLACWLLARIVHDRPEDWGLWIAFGFIFGTGLLAKYTMAIFAGLVFLVLLVDPTRRRVLLRPHPYVAASVAALVFIPVLVWNARHDWVTFRHTAGHMALEEGFSVSLGSAVNFLGGQIGIVGPFMLPALLWALFLDGDRSRRRFVTLLSLPVLGFFLLKSLQAKVQGNWALPGYIALYLSLAGAAVTARGGFRWILRGAIGVSLLMTLLMLSPDAVQRLGFRVSGQVKMMGWEELGSRVDALRAEMPDPARTFVASDYYMVASELAFYLPGNPETYAVNLGKRRMNQYDLWPGLGTEHAGWDGLFVIMGRLAVPAAVRTAFAHSEVLHLEVGTDAVRRPFTVIRGFGFRGFPQVEVKSF